MNFGTVLAVGPGKHLENGTLRPCTVKEGDIVLLPEYGGSKVTLGDQKDYFIYRDDDLMGTLHDPTKWLDKIMNFIETYLIEKYFELLNTYIAYYITSL